MNAWVWFWLVALLGFIALAIRAAQGSVLTLDLTLARAVQDLPASFDHLFSVTNWLGDGLPLAIITLGSAVAFKLGRCPGAALLLLLTFVARLGEVGVKYVVGEPRPSPDLVHVASTLDSFSFPSGHVVGVTAVFGLLFTLAPGLHLPRPFQTVLQIVSLLLVATVGLGRIWVGAHWPTDVLGGNLFGILFLIPAIVWLRSYERQSERQRRSNPSAEA